MGSVNKVILVGNLGRDAELRYTPGGAAVATLNLATTEVWNDKNQQRQEKTEWHRVVVWGKTGLRGYRVSAVLCPGVRRFTHRSPVVEPTSKTPVATVQRVYSA